MFHTTFPFSLILSDLIVMCLSFLGVCVCVFMLTGIHCDSWIFIKFENLSIAIFSEVFCLPLFFFFFSLRCLILPY